MGNHFYHVEVEFIILNYKLELQNLYFWTIKITQTRFQKSHSNTKNTHSHTFKHGFKKLTQTPKSLTLTLNHSPPSDTQTLTLLETIPSSVATHSDTQTFTLLEMLLSSAARKPSVKIPLILPFCQNPSLFVSFQHPTNESLYFFFHKAPKFQFLRYVFSFLCSFIVGPNFFVLPMDFIWFVPIFCFINCNPGTST